MKYILILASCLSLLPCGKKNEETRVVQKDIQEFIFASGTLEADDAYKLKAEVEGAIINLDYQEGDLVEVGNTLAIIENRQNEVNLKSAKQLLDLAQKNTLATIQKIIDYQ